MLTHRSKTAAMWFLEIIEPQDLHDCRHTGLRNWQRVVVCCSTVEVEVEVLLHKQFEPLETGELN